MNGDNPAFDYEDGTQKDGHFHETRGTNDYLQAIKHQLNGPCLLSLPLVATLLLIVYKLSQALNKTAQKYNLISLTF